MSPRSRALGIALVGLLAVLAIADARQLHESADSAADEPAAAGPAGKEMTFGKTDAYVTVPKGAAPTVAVIVFSDAKGWTLDATRAWTDKLAENGYLAILPDFLHGENMGNYSGAMNFFIGVSPRKVLAEFDSLVPAIKKKWPSVKKIAQIGFQWGGFYSGLLATRGLSGEGRVGWEDVLPKEPTTPRVAAAVAFAPNFLDDEVAAKVDVPLDIRAADPKQDPLMSGDVIEGVQSALHQNRWEKGKPAYVTIYKEQPANFMLAGDDTKVQKKAWNEAMEFLKVSLK